MPPFWRDTPTRTPNPVPTIMLTIDDDTLAALAAGEPIQLTGTLRRKKTKKAAELTPEQAALHATIADVVTHNAPGVSVARVWTEVKKHLSNEHPEDILPALDVCIDWCVGAPERVVWFARDYAHWREQSRRTPMDAEPDRVAWRAARGLK